MAGDTGIYSRPDNRSICRSRGRSPHVRLVVILSLDTRPHRSCTTLERVHRHVRTALGGLGLRARHRPSAVPFAMGAYITAAYWFTSSTSFANPAVTLARSLSNTFAGIRPADVIGFVAAQLAGAFAATLLFRWLVPSLKAQGSCVMLEHDRR